MHHCAALERGLDLSPIRLPLRAMAYPERQADYAQIHGVPGLIYDSLPDGWGFGLMHRRMRASGLDPQRATTLDRLAYLSANTMGALTYAPATADEQDTRKHRSPLLMCPVPHFLDGANRPG